MSTATSNRPAPSRGPRGGGPFGGMQGPVEKSMNFGPSAKRLLRRLSPERFRLVWIVLLTALSTIFTVLGPKLLGDATNLIFEGLSLIHI